MKVITTADEEKNNGAQSQNKPPHGRHIKKEKVMERTTGIWCRLLAILFVLFHSFEYLHAATIPVAVGNTWVYKYSDTVKSKGGFDQQFTVLSSKEGLFTMQIDSVITWSDTILFTMTNIDSGVTISGSVYKNKIKLKYMARNSGLSKCDSATGLWEFCSDELITYLPHKDTSYGWIVVGIDNEYIKQSASFNCSRNTDLSLLLVNNSDTSILHTTDTIYSWSNGTLDKVNHIIFGATSRISRDTLEWVDTIGVFYHINNTDSIYGNDFDLSTKYSTNSKETYTLIAFNGSPVSIVPIITSVINVSPNIRRTSTIQKRKVIFLGARSNRQRESSYYFNLLGRQLYGIDRGQLLIIKEELPLEDQRARK
jgi:hypothetical protein